VLTYYSGLQNGLTAKSTELSPRLATFTDGAGSFNTLGLEVSTSNKTFFAVLISSS